MFVVLLCVAVIRLNGSFYSAFLFIAANGAHFTTAKRVQ